MHRLRQLRHQRGYSLNQLAERSGTTKAQLIGIELGRRDPQLTTLTKIAKALDLELAALFVARGSRRCPRCGRGGVGRRARPTAGMGSTDEPGEDQ